MITIFLVQLLYVKGELTFADNLVVEFVPSRECRHFRSRKFAKTMQIKTINCQAKEVQGRNNANGERKGE